MADTKLSSLPPERRQASSTHQSFFKQISSRVASWFPVARNPVIVDKGLDIFMPGPWDRLIASSPPQPHSPAAPTALRFTHQKGALTSSLPEFVPCLGKYSPTRSASVGESHPGGSVSSTSVEPYRVLSSATSTSHPLVLITLPPTVITPVIPTIVVTDVDGPPASGNNDNCPDQMYRAMTCGRGLLWSQWSGRFSPSRCGSESGSRDGIHLQDKPGNDIEEFAEVDNEDNENYFKLHNDITPNAPEGFEATSEELKPILQEPKELEWWEIEGGDDETGSGDEDSEDSLEDDSDSEFDEDKDEDWESDSEDGDYEYADDSNDDDSGEDSDLAESEDSENILALGNPALGLGAFMPPPHQKPNSNIHGYTKDAEFVDRVAQDIRGLSPTSPTSTQLI